MSTSATSHVEGNAEVANKSYACQHCKKLLLPVMSQRRKVICPRCHGVYCAGCTIERHYGSTSHTNITTHTTTNVTSISSTVRLCMTCAATPDIVRRLTRNVWCLIIAFCAPQEQQRLLQLCRATQLGVMLPYTYISRGWGALFGARQLVFKGANGAVYETMLRSDIRLETISTRNNEEGEEVLCGPTIEDFTRLAGRTVAVKTVEKATVYSMKKWSHIEREVSAMQRCRHEHVVPLYFVAQGPSEVYIVMQYVEGGDLFDWLVRQQVPLESDVRLIARQLLTVLHFMHEHCGVVHRDIKPENILLDIGNTADVTLIESEQGTTNVPRLHIRLADFGYAKILPPQPVPAIKENAECAAIADNKEEETSTTQSVRAQTRPIRLRPTQQARGETNSTMAQGAREEQNEERLSEESEAMAWRLISTTPCGTLGFAAPEIIRAYNAKKAAMQRPDVVFVTEGEGNQSEAHNTREGSNDIVQRNTSTTRDSTSASEGASTRVASHVDPQTPIELFKRLDIFAAGVTLCILLTGCEPFPCTSSKEHLRAVLRGMDFSGPEWGYVSKPARRLLRQMLAASAAQRPSALQCLHSPWLRDTRDNSIITTVNTINTTSEAISTAAPPSQQTQQQTVPMSLECIPELVSQSFRQSVHTLRKNEPWLFVQDVTGQVTALPRHIVTGDEDQQALSQLNLAASNDTFITA